MMKSCVKADDFSGAYYLLTSFGQPVKPRGQLVVELENFSYELPPFERFSSFKLRKLNIDYIKKEFLWYLGGDRFDSSIVEHASMWKGLINVDGSINSNYGQYIFGKENQFDNVVSILSKDRDSRRASIIILNKDHLFSDTKDVPCTYAMNFRIRDNKLNMTVRMRSQDMIFGMGNDAPAFSFVHEMVVESLREFYPSLEYGVYYHSVDSFHVYERHFDMVAKITGIDPLTKKRLSYGDWSTDHIDCPKIFGPEEVKLLRKLDFSSVPDKFKFTKWLNTFKKEG